MTFKVKIIFGKEQTIKFFNEEPLSKEEQEINVKNYSFKTSKEKEAFLKGIDEAVGWTEYFHVLD